LLYTITKKAAVKALNNKAIPVNTIAYEYIDAIRLKEGNVIIAVEIETNNMIDLTHKSDYMDFINHRISNEASLIRRITMDNTIGLLQVAYLIKNNSCIRDVIKI